MKPERRPAIEPFRLAHHAAAVEMWRDIEGIRVSASDERTAIAAYLRRNRGMSFVARSGRRVVGTVLGGHDGRRGYLHHVAVAPDWRRKGIGAGLIRRALAALKRAGIERCHIFVLASNPDGLAFWTGAGWDARKDLRLFSRKL
jgi:ribosomal protein S18 acetylase RimI-like enzyme